MKKTDNAERAGNAKGAGNVKRSGVAKSADANKYKGGTKTKAGTKKSDASKTVDAAKKPAYAKTANAEKNPAYAKNTDTTKKPAYGVKKKNDRSKYITEKTVYGNNSGKSGKTDETKGKGGKAGDRTANKVTGNSKQNLSTINAKNATKTGIKKCIVNDQCGGCAYQGVPYKDQLKKKQDLVGKLFKGCCPVKPIVGMDDPCNYRNKVHAVLGEDRDHQIISGTYKAGTHHVVAVENCMLEDKKADIIIGTLRTLFKSFKYKPYDEDKQTGLMRHILIKRGFRTNEIMVVLVTASNMVPGKNNFVEALRKIHPEITTIIQNINDRSTSMVLGDKENVWFGKGYIEDELCGCTFRISSKSFYQINPVQTERLYNAAIEMAALTGKETVIDAYCGIGTIGLVAAEHAKKVIGIELNKDAVKDAISNAKRNSISNCDFYQKDAGKFMVEMSEDPKQTAVDIVIMDPPRSGSTEEFLTAVGKLRPEKVVYISCNPETQIRDVKYLEKKGYKAVECRPFDMFPYTEHVESIVLLKRI